MRHVGLAFAAIFVASPASALDCALAKSVAEKAICSDAEARAADEALGRSYNQLRAQLPDEEKASLRLSQIAWIRDRDIRCLAPSASKPLSICLAEETKRRQSLLEAKPLAGEIAVDSVRPTFVVRPAAIGSARLNIEAIKFTGDGAWQAKINSSIDRLVKDAIADSDIKDSHNEPAVPSDSIFVDLHVTLSFASPSFVSVSAEYENYLGQAHSFHWQQNINFDVRAARELSFDDLLNEADGKKIFEYCRSQVAKEKMDRADFYKEANKKDDIDLEEVTEGTKEFWNWRFLASSADISYSDYAFGGYAQCMCSCTIPYSMLRPIAKKDFPLP
jgi:uncharacterized protein YecT (DUF1311 family)